MIKGTLQVDRQHRRRKLGAGAFGAAYATSIPGVVIKVSWYNDDGFRTYIEWLNKKRVKSSARPIMFPATATKALLDSFWHPYAYSAAVFVGEKLVESDKVIRRFKDFRQLERALDSLAEDEKIDIDYEEDFHAICKKYKIKNREDAFKLLRKLSRHGLASDMHMGNVMFREVRGGWEMVITDPCADAD